MASSANTDFNDLLLKSIIGTINSLDEIKLYTKGKDSFFEKICDKMGLPPDKKSMKKIAVNYNRKLKPIIAIHFEGKNQAKLNLNIDEQCENNQSGGNGDTNPGVNDIVLGVNVEHCEDIIHQVEMVILIQE